MIGNRSFPIGRCRDRMSGVESQSIRKERAPKCSFPTNTFMMSSFYVISSLRCAFRPSFQLTTLRARIFDLSLEIRPHLQKQLTVPALRRSRIRCRNSSSIVFFRPISYSTTMSCFSTNIPSPVRGRYDALCGAQQEVGSDNPGVIPPHRKTRFSQDLLTRAGCQLMKQQLSAVPISRTNIKQHLLVRYHNRHLLKRGERPENRVKKLRNDLANLDRKRCNNKNRRRHRIKTKNRNKRKLVFGSPLFRPRFSPAPGN